MEQRVRPQKLRVIDVHTHFPIENTMGGPPPGPRHPLLEAYARERGERMRAEWGTAPAEPLARTDQEVDAALERWVGEVERYDLDKVVFVSGGGNDRLAGLVAKHPDRFVGLAHHRLEPGAGAELRRAVDELGLRGYKLLGPTTDYPFEAPELRDVWEFLAERQLPALIHFGFLGRGGGVVQHPRMSPLSLFEVARDFPEVPFIVPHFGAGYFQDLLALCWSLPNVYIDTSAYTPARYPSALIEFMKSKSGRKRVLWGSNYPMIGPAAALEGVDSLGLDEQARGLFLGGNARRIFSLE